MSISKLLQIRFLIVIIISTSLIALLSFYIYFVFASRNMTAETQSAMDTSADLIRSRIDDIDILTEKAQFYSKSDYDLMSDLRHYLPGRQYSEDEHYYSEREMTGIFRALIYRMPEVNFVGVVLANHSIISYSNTTMDFEYRYDPSNAPWFRHTRQEHGDLLITKLPEQAAGIMSTDKQTLMFSRNIYDFYTKEYLGMFVVDCDPSVFTSLSKGLSPSVNGYNLVGQRYHQKLVNVPSDKNQHVQQLSTIIKDTAEPLKLTATIDNSAYSQLLKLLLGLIFVVTVVVMFLTYLLSRIFTRQFTQPIIALSQNMQTRKEVRDLGAQTVQSNSADEIRVLYASYFEMLQSLKQSLEDQQQSADALMRSELNVYKNQIDSHFLYNVLESINSIAEVSELDDISTMTVSLARMFRYASNGFVNEASIGEELRNVRDYLAIQRIRYQQSIDLEVLNPQALPLTTAVPKLIMQPLVENAIFHGLKDDTRHGRIRILISQNATNLLIRVYDNGRGIPREELIELQERLRQSTSIVRTASRHIGLINIDARIRLNYGDLSGVYIFSNLGFGTVVEVRLPHDQGDV